MQNMLCYAIIGLGFVVARRGPEGGVGSGGILVVPFPIAPVVDFEDCGGCVCISATYCRLSRAFRVSR